MSQFLEEMNRMNWYVEKSISKWQSELAPVLEAIKDVRHWMALPYHTIAINRILGSSVDDAACMGAIFRLYLLSDYVHSLVKDDDEGQTYNSDLQFNILIGDMLYGSALCLLSENNWEHLLPVFSNMIVQVNEGHALAYSDKQYDPIKLAAKEWGSFYRASFSTAGIVNKQNTEIIKQLDTIGLDLGLSVAAIDLGLNNTHMLSARFKESINRLLSNLNITNTFKRLDIWTSDTNVLVPAAG